MKMYILKEGIPILTTDKNLHHQHMTDISRRLVRYTESGNINVSTVFIGYNIGIDSNKFFFETLVTGGHIDGHTWCYKTWDDANKGHSEAIKFAFGGIGGWQESHMLTQEYEITGTMKLEPENKSTERLLRRLDGE